MFLPCKKLIPVALILIVCLLLAACGTSGNNGSDGSTGSGSAFSSSQAPVTITPQLVTPKASNGSPGKGPLVISSPTAVSGGQPGSQQIVLGDRTLIINSVTEQKGASASSALVSLDLTIQNTSGKAILNLSSFFQLMGAEGDTFSYQYHSSNNFYSPIAAHTTRSGTIVFQIPAAAAKLTLHLLYRPEIATETVITLLKIS